MVEDLVQWSDEYSVGIEEVDEQHRGLIGLVNRAHAAVIEHASSADVETLVHALEAYTVQHFRDEEGYMEAAHYPKLPQHRQAHAAFIERVAAEKAKLLAGYPLQLDLVRFLRDWLVNHILRMDKEFGRFEQAQAAHLKARRAGFFSRLMGAPATTGGLLGRWLRSRKTAASAVVPDAAPIDTEVPPVEEEPTPSETGLDFQGAIEVHMRWKARLKAVVDGTSSETLDPAIVALDDRCALGTWLHGAGKERFAANPDYQKVVDWHRDFHRCAAGILEAMARGDTDVARDELERGEYMRAGMRLRSGLARMFFTLEAPVKRR